MKTLAVSVLLFATMALTGAAPRSALVRRFTACSAPWTEIGGRCFLYVPALLNWSAAEKNCQTMNAHLASVHSRHEHRKIQNLVAKASHVFGETWIGGSDCQIEGVWLWSDGTAFNYKQQGSIDNWFGRQHCLLINYGVHKWWDDQSCYTKYPSVCAKQM